MTSSFSWSWLMRLLAKFSMEASGMAIAISHGCGRAQRDVRMTNDKVVVILWMVIYHKTSRSTVVVSSQATATEYM